MKKEFKVAIFDLDGTLTNSKKELSPRNREALISLQEQGVKVVLASGRPTYGIIPIADEINLSHYGGYILSFNGGVILDYAANEVIYSQQLGEDLIAPLYQASVEEGCVILSYRGREILTEDTENQYVKFEAMLNKMPTRRVESFVEEFACKVPKCLAVGDPERSIALEKRLVAKFGTVMNIYRSEPFFVELVPLGIDKAQSLARLAQHLAVTSEDMIAFGDGFNDLSMIEFAGHGVAMANAQEVVRQRANATTLTNDEDGVAHYLESNILHKKC
ncbi:MAG: Cof-type HAD-IIB family hydrolase [Rikenellaceae bacterium]